MATRFKDPVPEYAGMFRVGPSRKFPDGAWLVRYRNEAGVTNRRTLPTKQMAIEFWRSTPRGRRLRPLDADPTLGLTPLRDVAESWFRQESGGWKPATEAGYRSLLDCHILPAIGDRAIGTLKTRDIEAFRSGLPGSVGSKRNIMMVLNQVMSQAVRHELIPSNPCQLVRPERRNGVMKERLFLTVEQVHALADELGPEDSLLVELAAFSGMRFGELVALRVRHLDLLHQQILVSESVAEVNGHLHIGPPKNGRPRTVKLASHLVEPLKMHIARLGPDSFIFGRLHDRPMRHSPFYQGRFKPAVRRALPDSLHGLRFHDLRHTTASLLIHAGVQPKAISDHLGHSGIQITLDLYGHLYPEGREAVGRALDAIYETAPRTSAAKVVPLKRVGRRS